MALVNPNIAMSYRGVEMPQQNALADYAAIQQIQSGQRQAEVSQMQIEQMRRDDATLKQIQAKSMENGGPADLDSIADAYLKSGNAKFVEFGIGLRQKLDEKKQFASIMGSAPRAAAAPASEAYPGYNEAIGMAAPAPAAAPASEPYPGYNQAIGMTPSVNAMAPAAAPAANALADVVMLRQKRDALLSMGTPQAIAAARALDSDIALASKAPVYHSVPGVGLVNPITKEVVMAAKAAPAGPTNLATLQAELALLPKGDPRIPAYEAMIKKETQFAPRAITNVNMPPQERAEQGERGKMLVGEYSDISKAAKLAAKILPSIDANLSILDKGFSTGFGAETVAAGAKVLAALGVAEADKFATNAQVFQAKATEAVLQKQLEQKGPQTESDAQRIDQIGAQLGKTTAGNKFVLTTAKEQLKRDMEQRNFYDKWWKTNKTYDGAEDAWYSGEGGKSLFDRPAVKGYIKSAEAAAAPAAANRPSLDNIFSPKK
jgi:hypothetical protein